MQIRMNGENWARILRVRAYVCAMSVALAGLSPMACGGSGAGSNLNDFDIQQTDGSSDADTTQPDILLPDTNPVAGEFGSECEEDSDCDSGLCLKGPLDLGICSEPCVGDCPEGWLCVEVARVESGFACVPQLGKLCSLCQTDADCGSKLDKCTPVGDDGLTYCTEHCDTDADCPGGYYCSPPASGSGSQQCLPVSGKCECPPEMDGTTRPCQLTNDHGVCFGLETCNGPWGWTDCTAPTPADETCDGEDNDCDGNVDEPATNPVTCTTENEFGSCDGHMVCTGQVEACGALEAAPEVCDGADNNCDGQIDEDVLVPCQNACGHPGSAACVNGEAGDCDMAEVPEICADGVDNDCDGDTDEADCIEVNMGQPGADVVFSISDYHASNVVTDKGDGTYVQTFFGMADPNATGTAWAQANLVTDSEPVSWKVKAGDAASLQLVVTLADLYDDRRETQVVVQVQDDKGRPAQEGTQVDVALSGAGLSGGASCLTAADGRCTLDLTLPESAFDATDDVTLSATVGTLAPVEGVVHTHKRPDALTLEKHQAALLLPVSPRWDPQVHSEEFDVPVMVNSGVIKVGAYDFKIIFNPAHLEVLEVQKGGNSGVFSTPVSNYDAGANTTGVLKFNGYNVWEAHPSGQGENVHVATVRFKPKAGLFPGMVSPIAAEVVSMFSTSLIGMEVDENVPGVLFQDEFGVGTSGSVTTMPVTVSGVLARSPAALLFAWDEILGASDAVKLAVTGVQNDGALVDLSDDPATAYESSNEALLEVDDSGTATALMDAGKQGGWVDVSITHKGMSATATAGVVVPTSYSLALSDDELQPISGHPNGISQSARLGMFVDWVLDGVVLSTMDITTQVSVIVPSQLMYKSILRELSGVVEGDYVVEARGAVGNVLASVNLAVTTLTSAVVTGLDVVAPCRAVNLAMVPEEPLADPGTAEMKIAVYGLFNTVGETCQTQVYAVFDDGNRMRVTGDSAIVLSSSDPTIVSSTAKGKLTAANEGIAIITADLNDGSGGTALATGDTHVAVKP